METNSKDIFWSFKIFWKFGISIVHTNMYSCAKVGMQTQTRKIHTKMTNFRWMCTKRQNLKISGILSFSIHAPEICHFRRIFQKQVCILILACDYIFVFKF